MLSRREVLLTQLCTIDKLQGKELVGHALRQLPVIMKALKMEPVGEQEIVNLVIELEAVRTEIALRILTALGKRGDPNAN